MKIKVDLKHRAIVVPKGTSKKELYNYLKNLWYESFEHRCYEFPVRMEDIIVNGIRLTTLRSKDSWNIEIRDKPIEKGCWRKRI